MINENKKIMVLVFILKNNSMYTNKDTFVTSYELYE